MRDMARKRLRRIEKRKEDRAMEIIKEKRDEIFNKFLSEHVQAIGV